jgi:hypothetical protein
MESSKVTVFCEQVALPLTIIVKIGSLSTLTDLFDSEPDENPFTSRYSAR